MANAAKHAKGSRIQGQQLALILVLVGATAASVLVPWLVSSGTNATAQPSPATTGPTPLGLSAPSSPAATPSPSTVGPTTPAPVTSTRASASASPGRSATPQTRPFRPIAIEAEDPGNIPPDGAMMEACSKCSGGYRMKYVRDPLVVPVTVPTAGTRSVTVVFEAGDVRMLLVAVGETIVFNRSVVGPDWVTPQNVTFTAYIPAGTVRISLNRADHPGPDLDKIIIA